jgi:NAD+ diphosphatase
MHRESIYSNYIPAVTTEKELNTLSYWFIFYLDRLLVKIDNDKALIPIENSLEELKVTAVRNQYLGTFKGCPCYSVEVASDTISTEGMCYKDLRSLYPFVEEDIFLLAGKALQIVNWDKTHQYCGKCGSKTETLQGERAKKCPSCGFVSYPVLSPAVITAIIKDNKILLAHNANFRGNMHSLIAGFVEPGETLEEAVQREIIEEVGLKVKNIQYWGSQPWPFPNSLMLGFTAEYESGEIEVDGVEITHADWFEADKLPELPSEISIARKIINWHIENYNTEITENTEEMEK